VLLAARFHRKGRRGAHPAPAWLGIAAAALLFGPAYGLYHVAVTSHDPMIRMNPLILRMAGQHAEHGKRAPGFTLPDGLGRTISLSEFRGKIIVLAIINPDNAESARSLDLLESVHRKFAKQGVQCVAVCTSQDEGAAATLARGMPVSFPIVQDIGAYNGPSGLEQAPIAEAYEALYPPKVIVTDRRRRLRDVVADRFAYEGSELEQAILKRLESEPE
jgi:peroxiredoxin